MSQEPRRALAAIVREERERATADGIFLYDAFRKAMEARAPDAWATEHFCLACGRPASFGYGVSMRAGIAGVWYCLEHRPDAQ